jgi:hypothetical protein
LGLLGVAVFIPIVIGLAAGMTWLVVRISPPANGNSAAKQSSRSR